MSLRLPGETNVPLPSPSPVLYSSSYPMLCSPLFPFPSSLLSLQWDLRLPLVNHLSTLFLSASYSPLSFHLFFSSFLKPAPGPSSSLLLSCALHLVLLFLFLHYSCALVDHCTNLPSLFLFLPFSLFHSYPSSLIVWFPLVYSFLKNKATYQC